MPCKLSVNVNAIAYLRNRRHVPWPSLEHLGRLALDAGAAGLTVHPRPDERHVRTADVPVLRKLLSTQYPGREFNIEGYPDERFLALVEATLPDQVTLVPDAPGQSTSDHGWDIAANRAGLEAIISRLHRGNMRVSLFIDPDPAVPALAKAVGADRVEIYTGPYGGSFDERSVAQELAKVIETGKAAAAAGVGLNAGHDLTVANLPPVVAALPNLLEVSIGHAVIAEAMEFGMAGAVKRFRKAIGDL